MATVLPAFLVSAADLDRDVVCAELARFVDGDDDFAQVVRRETNLLSAAPTKSEALVSNARSGLRRQAQDGLIRQASAGGRLAEDEGRIHFGESDVVDEGIGVVLKIRRV